MNATEAAPVPAPAVAPPRSPVSCLAALHSELRQLHQLETDSETLHSLQGRRMALLVAQALGDELAAAERKVSAAAAGLAASLEAAIKATEGDEA